jgi:DNA-binding CsgD family transcriptional regulator
MLHRSVVQLGALLPSSGPACTGARMSAPGIVPPAEPPAAVRAARRILDPSEVVLSLLPELYGSVDAPERWQAFISRLSTFFRTRHGVLLLQRLQCPSIDRTVLAVVGSEPAFPDSYGEYYGTKNVYLPHGRSKLTPGAVRFQGELCPRQIAERSELFSDWIRPQRLGDSLFATVLEEQDVVGVLCVDHEEHVRRYEEFDRRLLALLMPHLQQALRLHRRVVALKARAEAVESALDAWSAGVIVLDKTGAPLVANRSARAILDARSGLLIDSDELRTSTARETCVLRELVHNAIQTTAICCTPLRKASASVTKLTPGGLMLVERPAGKPALQLMVCPVGSKKTLPCVPGAAAVVLVNDPASTNPGGAEVLRLLYGLTETESRVAGLLLEGSSLPAVAEELSVSLNTIKTHAKRIYAKTGTRGQADLIRSEANAPAFSR